MFQCHSPKSSHPLPLPQSPKDCSIHLCLFCCLAYRVIVTIFLNSIYMRYVHVVPILNLPPPALPIPYPSESSQCTSPKLPVSCIEPGLAIRFIYDIIHVSMPFSQIIPSLRLPQSPKDCSIHLCLFCCHVYRVIVTISLNSIYMH